MTPSEITILAGAAFAYASTIWIFWLARRETERLARGETEQDERLAFTVKLLLRASANITAATTFILILVALSQGSAVFNRLAFVLAATMALVKFVPMGTLVSGTKYQRPGQILVLIYVCIVAIALQPLVFSGESTSGMIEIIFAIVWVIAIFYPWVNDWKRSNQD